MAYNKTTGEYEGFIYLIINNINGKRYIGQTIQTIQKRWNSHVAKYGKRPMVDKAIDLYGKENFTVKEIEKISFKSKAELKNQLNILEQFYIKKYNTLSKNKMGYNLTEGGDTPSTYSEKPVVQYDMFGKEINTYKSITEASEKTGVAIGDISHCCNKDNVSASGFMWSFYGDTYNKDKSPINRPVVKYDVIGNKICTYKNVNSITDDKKIRNKIRNCCTGSIRNIDGYVYRYWNDSFNKFLPICKNETLDHYKPIDRYSVDGELLSSYKNCKSINDIDNVSITQVLKVCHNEAKTHLGFIWKFNNNAIKSA